MRRSRSIALLFLTAFVLAGCSSTHPAVAPQLCGIERGMSETQFQWGEPYRCSLRSFDMPYFEELPVGTISPKVVGPRTKEPVRSIRVDEDLWHVWVYDVYRRTNWWTLYDHGEYAIFKNGQLVAWGVGTPSKALLVHPEETFEFAGRERGCRMAPLPYGVITSATSGDLN